MAGKWDQEMIRQILENELNALVPLFDAYMVFYGQPSHPRRYRDFLTARLLNKEATVYGHFLESGALLGFVLNYVSFSSVSLGKIVILNDLFVVPARRSQGIGKALIRRTFDFAGEIGAVRVDLGTAKTNVVAQRLYENIGFVRDSEFYIYNYSI